MSLHLVGEKSEEGFSSSLIHLHLPLLIQVILRLREDCVAMK